MTALISSTLGFLVLLTVSQAADPNCEELTKTMVLEDDHSSIMGRWIFAEGLSNHPIFTNVLLTVNSSWIEFYPHPLEHTVTLVLGHMSNGRCEVTSMNMTVKHNKFFASVNGTTSEADVLPSCSDCRTLHFTIQMKNETINALYLYTRAHRASKSDMEVFWKQAECLGFNKEPQFSYDGVTEFCQADKNSTSTDHTKPEQKKDE